MRTEAFEVLGVVLEWKVRGEETGGKYCLVTAMVLPGVMVPPHQHVEPESFYLLEGEGEFASLIDGELVWKSVRVGDVVNIPSDSVHGFRNASSSNMRCIITADPGIQGFFDEAGLPLSATPAPPTPADIERVLAIARKHGQRFLPAA